MKLANSEWLRSCGPPLIGAWVVGAMWLPVPGWAQSPKTIDELEYETAIDDSLFSSEFNLKNWSGVSLGKYGAVQISSEIGTDSADLEEEGHITGGGISVSRTDTLVVKRISASLAKESGTLTVGSDWTNFQDVLTRDRVLGVENRENPVFRQIRWLSPDGFSISLEESSPSSSPEGNTPPQDSGQGVSSLILSWQGGAGGRAGEYRVAALGTRLDAASSGRQLDIRDVNGWGLKLEGGWRIGDLFAALSVTYGKGINRYILRRYGNQLLVMANADSDPADAYSIRPSLYYSLNENAHFHVALGRHAVDSAPETAGQDTLDTIHMGYNWSPWPSTEFGIELVGRNPNGTQGSQGKTRFRIGARKNF